jgi:hypothetical protein
LLAFLVSGIHIAVEVFSPFHGSPFCLCISMLEKPQSRSVAERTFLTPAQAKQAFKRMKAALLDVRNWKRLSGAPNTFELYQGNEPSTHVRAYVGDFIRIAAPGPFPAQWVQVTKIKFRHHSVELVVRPSYDPTEKEVRKEVTCHIFRSKATNTFVLSRKKATIHISITGRNEFTNTVAPECGSGAWLNLIASIGLWFGFQKELWDTFVSRLISINPKRLAIMEGGVRMHSVDGHELSGHQAAVRIAEKAKF